MARPRKDDPSACKRIEKAFWELLETEGIESITISSIARKSGVNRNTIYYHFENVESMIQQIIENSVDPKMVETFLHALLSSNPEKPLEKEILENSRKLHLLAKSQSPFLRNLLEKQLLDSWLKLFKIDPQVLNEYEKNILHFLAGGISSILSRKEVLQNPSTFQEFPKSIIGRSVFQTLEEFQMKSRKEES